MRCPLRARQRRSRRDNISEGNTNFGYFLNYATLRSDLLTFGQPGFFNSTNLPSATNIQGFSNFWVSSAEAKIFGINTSIQGNAPDGFGGIGTGFSAGAVRISAFLHEIGHALGRVPENYTGNNTTYSSALDLWRFTSQGVRLFDPATNPSVQNPETAAYFSLNGGATDLADWGQTSDPSDFRGPGSNPPSNLTPNDPFDEIVGNLGQLTTIDREVMEALGFKSTPPMFADYFIAKESKTGDLIYGYVYDTYGRYSIGSTYTSPTDQLGGTWTYTVNNVVTVTDAAHTNSYSFYNGKVYDYYYYDADRGSQYFTDFGYTGMSKGAPTDQTDYSGANFLGSDSDYAMINGTWQLFGAGNYVVSEGLPFGMSGSIDTLGGSSAASSSSDPQVSQMVQAMASFPSGGSSPLTSPISDAQSQLTPPPLVVGQHGHG
jgi:hypothetical protein